MKVKIVLAVIFLAAVGYYTFNKVGPVKPFISTEEIAKSLNVDVQHIQYIYELAEDYRYVPYMKDDVPSMSLWKFEYRHWRKINDIVGDEITLIELKDGAKYYIWNIKGEGMSQLNLYAIHERNYDVTHKANGEMISKYYPEIVLTYSEKIEPSISHGIFEMPEAWHNAFTRNPQTEQQPFGFFENPQMFAWEVVNEENEVVKTIRPDGTFSQSSGDDDSQLHFMSQFQRWDNSNIEED